MEITYISFGGVGNEKRKWFNLCFSSPTVCMYVYIEFFDD